MNVLFITLLDIRSIDENNIYADLMREFAKDGHEVYIVSPIERRHGMKTMFLENQKDELNKRVHILKVKTGNIQKTNIIEKGLSTVLLEYILLREIKKYFNDVKYDLVLYSTPPITLISPINYIKKRDNAKTYLMLKDIFPQNAVDMGMLSTTGLKGVLYKYFKRKEKKLYAISDRIGCMSKANVDYILNQNPEISSSKIEVCSNSIEVRDMSITAEERFELRNIYGIPQDKKVFIYGGNLGKPQGIPFIIECLKSQEENKDAFFLIVGDGTEYTKLEAYFSESKPTNMKLMRALPKSDYDRMVAACDVGMIFLDHRFTIPNYPSRLLAYMQVGLPVLACTDRNTDIGKDIVAGGFGWWCESNNVDGFKDIVNIVTEKKDFSDMQKKELDYLKEFFSSEVCYKKIFCKD